MVPCAQSVKIIFSTNKRSHLHLLKKNSQAKSSHCNRNPCDREFRKRVKYFSAIISQQVKVGHMDLPFWPTKLLWKWFRCELCFIHCCTIENRLDNGPFLLAKFCWSDHKFRLARLTQNPKNEWLEKSNAVLCISDTTLALNYGRTLVSLAHKVNGCISFVCQNEMLNMISQDLFVLPTISSYNARLKRHNM